MWHGVGRRLGYEGSQFIGLSIISLFFVLLVIIQMYYDVYVDILECLSQIISMV